MNAGNVTDAQRDALRHGSRTSRWIEHPADVEWVEIAPGIRQPERFVYREPPRDGELRAALHMRVVDGHAVCERVELEPWTTPAGQTTPLSRTTIRGLPFGRLVDNARMEAAAVSLRQPAPADPDPAYWARQRAIEALIARQRGEPDPVRAATRGPRKRGVAIPMDDAELERLGEIYKDAVRLGQRPTAAVKSHYDVSRSVASRWIRRARDRGLIPEARKDA